MATRIFRTLPAAVCGVLLAERPNGGPYQRCLPTIAGPRPKRAARDLWRHYYEQVSPPPARLVALRDATVRGPGVITLPGDIIVAESLINADQMDPIGNLRRIGPDRFAAEPNFPGANPAPPGRHVLLKQFLDANYGHWLIEGLPRMGLLEGVVDIAGHRFIVSSLDGMSPLVAPMRAVMTDSLAWFGVQPEQITVTGWAPQFFPELLYPLPMTIQPWVKAPYAIRVLEACAARLRATHQPEPGAQKLYIRRPATSRRRLINEDAIQAALTALGFITINPAALSVDAQCLAFRDARIVVATLGAECANLAFAPTGIQLIGLAPPDMQDDFFYDLVSLKSGAYSCLHGTADNETGMNAAFTIDEAALMGMVA
jgi:hypothetical protein